ncbi:MAG: DivIVA domain-containing protein [Clostridia bacterium]|nr:DivIVA domain-containing protein [Clostridia bacterium]
MLTPQEIQEQKFEKAVFGGYDMAQIDKFLDVVLNDYTSLYKENTALKAKMRVLVDKIEEYRAVDEELRKTLYNAQIAAKDTVSRAQTEAERILRDAQFAASRNVTDLQAQVTAEEKRLEDAKRANAAYAGKIRRAMELGLRQMEEILSESAAGKAGAEVRQSAPQTEPAPAPQPEPAFCAEPAPAPQPASAPGEEGVVLDLEVEEEQHARKADPQSDTARIYGDSPFTPKPRFDFNDMRFGKQYDADADQE